MNAFISYSRDDIGFVKQMHQTLIPHVKTRYWEHDKVPGMRVWGWIFGLIGGSKCLIPVITNSVLARGESVHHEVGYAIGRGIPVIPVVGADVSSDRLGCLAGLTHIRLDPGRESEALEEIRRCVVALRNEHRLKAILFAAWLLLIALLVLIRIAVGRKSPSAVMASGSEAADPITTNGPASSPLPAGGPR